jgi:DNA replication protein DnaC
MTNNETYERVHENLSWLKMNTAESILDLALDRFSKEEHSFLDMLDHLLAEEVRHRRTSSIETRTKLASFPSRKYLEDFDLAFQPSIDRLVYDDLKSLRFLANGENVILLGPPGVGKTHIAIGLGIEAVRAGYSSYYVNSASMINKLRSASQRGTLERALKNLCRPRLLIVDEIGYLPMDREGANLFFQLVSRRYEKGSTIYTSNKSYGEWGEILGDNTIATAVLDRILHHSVTLNIRGDSYRLQTRKRAGLPPPTNLKNQDGFKYR